MDDIIVWIIMGILCLIGSFIAAFIWNFGLTIRVGQLEQAHFSLERSVTGTKGQQVKKEKAERTQEAIVKGMALLKEGKTPQEIMQIVGAEYPDIALDLIKKM